MSSRAEQVEFKPVPPKLIEPTDQDRDINYNAADMCSNPVFEFNRDVSRYR